ncbi:MAG: N-acetyltransferase family protein [Methanomassiliicoccales archaeon]
MSDIAVRDFRTDDAQEVAEIMCQDLQRKFEMLRDEVPPEDLPCMVAESEMLKESEVPGYLVAEREGRVVGFLFLKWRGQERPAKGDGLSYRGWKLRFGLSLLTDSPKEGECFIEHLGAEDLERVGPGLIDRGKEEASRRGLDSLVVHLAPHHQAEIDFFGSQGFREVGRLDSPLAQRTIGVGEWIRLSLPL